MREPVRRLGIGLAVGLAIGLLGGVLEGITYNIHGGLGMGLVLITYILCLAGFGIFGLGWVIARFTHRGLGVWDNGLALVIGTGVGSFGGFAVVMTYLGRV